MVNILSVTGWLGSSSRWHKQRGSVSGAGGGHLRADCASSLCGVGASDQPADRVLAGQQWTTQPFTCPECYHQHLRQSPHDTEGSAATHWLPKQWQTGEQTEHCSK